MTALVGGYVPNFFFPLWFFRFSYQAAHTHIHWPRVGQPFHSFLDLGCGGCALTFAGIMFLCI